MMGSMMGFESVSWEHKVVIYWWMTKISKGVGMSKRRRIAVSSDTTLKERCLGKVNDCLVVLNTIT